MGTDSRGLRTIGWGSTNFATDPTDGIYWRTSPGALQMGTYIGTGTATQRLAVVSAQPTFVWVMGAVASASRGAFRFVGQSGTTSHPWTSDPAASDTGRFERITEITSDGFQVGTSLNVADEPFFWTCFATTSGTVATGTYTGIGYSRESASTLTSSSALGTVSAIGSFRTQDVGQDVMRVSDDAKIATITSFNSASNCNATVFIDGTFAGGAWYFRPMQVDLGFVPDYVLVAGDDTINAISPAQIAPGAASSVRTGETQNAFGTAITPAIAFVTASSRWLEVANDGPSGAAGYNVESKVYRWFALKANNNFAKLDYTGDGLNSRTLTGVPFAPGFWMDFGEQATPHWKAKNSLVTGGVISRALLDTSATQSDNIVFTSDGVTMTNAPFNVSGRSYRAIFMLGGGFEGVCRKNNAETTLAASADTSDGVFHAGKIIASTASAQFLLDGTSIGTITTNIPTVDLGPGLGYSGATQSQGIEVDYFAMVQTR